MVVVFVLNSSHSPVSFQVRHYLPFPLHLCSNALKTPAQPLSKAGPVSLSHACADCRQQKGEAQPQAPFTCPIPSSKFIPCSPFAPLQNYQNYAQSRLIKDFPEFFFHAPLTQSFSQTAVVANLTISLSLIKYPHDYFAIIAKSFGG
jgi:hypothetical protein